MPCSYCGMSEPIEQPDNNFIALRKVGAGNNVLYAEFQNGTDGNVDFKTPMHYELVRCLSRPLTVAI